MSLVNFLFGKPLASAEDRAEKIGSAAGVPIFGLDALGSAAYYDWALGRLPDTSGYEWIRADNSQNAKGEWR
jgi:hypothetical protein